MLLWRQQFFLNIVIILSLYQGATSLQNRTDGTLGLAGQIGQMEYMTSRTNSTAGTVGLAGQIGQLEYMTSRTNSTA